jgi:hypothetical protein
MSQEQQIVVSSPLLSPVKKHPIFVSAVTQVTTIAHVDLPSGCMEYSAG